MNMRIAVILMLTALLIPLSIFAESSQPKEQNPGNNSTDLLNVALEVAKATSAPRVSPEPPRPTSPPAVVQQQRQPSDRTSTIVVYKRPGYIAPPTSYRSHGNFGPTKIIGRGPHGK